MMKITEISSELLEEIAACWHNERETNGEEGVTFRDFLSSNGNEDMLQLSLGEEEFLDELEDHIHYNFTFMTQLMGA